MRRVRTVDGAEPIMCQESWLNLSECPGLLSIDYTSESLFNAVQRCAGRKITTAYALAPGRPAVSTGLLLACSEVAALLLLEQNISLEDGVIIEWTNIRFRALVSRQKARPFSRNRLKTPDDDRARFTWMR